MPATPKRRNRKASSGSRFLSDVFAANVRMSRFALELKQAEIAEQMRQLGHEWSPATVSEVEGNMRGVPIDELGALAFILKRTIPDLLDPTGIDGRGIEKVDFGGQLQSLTFPAEVFRKWLKGEMSELTYSEGIFTLSGDAAALSASQSLLEQHRPASKNEDGD
jgi:transcriptional regulator with XRE-family HTH domain